MVVPFTSGLAVEWLEDMFLIDDHSLLQWTCIDSDEYSWWYH